MKKVLSFALALILIFCALSGVLTAFAETEGDFVYEITDGESELGDVVITRYNGNSENVIIPETIGGRSVTAIGENAFRNNKTVKNVTIPKSVSSIDTAAFCSCTNLTGVTFEGLNLYIIGEEAFSECKSLKSITLPDSIKEIGAGAFFYCEKLTDVSMGKNVNYLGHSAFSHCESLKSIDLPGSLESIQIWTFKECKSLKSVNISQGMSSIDGLVFISCTSLKSINIPTSVKYIDCDAFVDCPALKELLYEGDLSQWKSIKTLHYFENEKLKINCTDGYYYKDKAYKVKLSLSKISVKNTASKLKLKATLKVNGKAAKNQKLTFTFNGKKYKAKTNSKGVAKVTVKKSVLKKLEAGKKITYKVGYGKVVTKKSAVVK